MSRIFHNVPFLTSAAHLLRFYRRQLLLAHSVPVLASSSCCVWWQQSTGRRATSHVTHREVVPPVIAVSWFTWGGKGWDSTQSVGRWRHIWRHELPKNLTSCECVVCVRKHQHVDLFCTATEPRCPERVFVVVKMPNWVSIVQLREFWFTIL